MQTSLLKTLAGKHGSTVTKMARKYAATIQTPHGPRTCMQAVVDRGEGKQPSVATFGGIPLRRQRTAVLHRSRSRPSDFPPQRADPSAPGGTVRVLRELEKVRVRQIRKLADLDKPGQPQPEWAQIMAGRRRKTLVVCERVLRHIHPKRPTRVIHGTVAGEPGELKGSCRVREGARGNGASSPPRLWPTSSTRTYDGRHLARVRNQAGGCALRRRWCRRGAVAGPVRRSRTRA